MRRKCRASQKEEVFTWNTLSRIERMNFRFKIAKPHSIDINTNLLPRHPYLLWISSSTRDYVTDIVEYLNLCWIYHSEETEKQIFACSEIFFGHQKLNSYRWFMGYWWNIRAVSRTMYVLRHFVIYGSSSSVVCETEFFLLKWRIDYLVVFLLCFVFLYFHYNRRSFRFCFHTSSSSTRLLTKLLSEEDIIYLPKVWSVLLPFVKFLALQNS